MKYLEYLCKKYDITEGYIVLACDNKASLEHALLYDNRASISHGSFDLLWSIQDLTNTLPITILPQHVYGHQDQLHKKLSLLEKLNCFVDAQAGTYRSLIESTHQFNYTNLHLRNN